MRFLYTITFLCLHGASYNYSMNDVEILHIKIHGKMVFFPIDSDTTIRDIKKTLCINQQITNPELRVLNGGLYFTTRFLNPMTVLNDNANVKAIMDYNNTKTFELVN